MCCLAGSNSNVGEGININSTIISSKCYEDVPHQDFGFKHMFRWRLMVILVCRLPTNPKMTRTKVWLVSIWHSSTFIATVGLRLYGWVTRLASAYNRECSSWIIIILLYYNDNKYKTYYYMMLRSLPVTNSHGTERQQKSYTPWYTNARFQR